MSVEAMNWAFAQQVSKSSAKFVLVAMADHAKEEGGWICWPSVTTLCKKTGQDRKTVISSIKRLIEDGFIAATGDKKNCVNVYQLMLTSTENG